MAKLTALNIICRNKKPCPPVCAGDLAGKTVVLIGGNAGIGLQTALHLSRMNPARFIITARSESKGAAAIQTIKEVTGYAAELWILDVADFPSVVKFADKFEREGGPRLDLLICNAGVYVVKYDSTKDGWESTLQVNCLSLALIQLLLLPRMMETAQKFGTKPRIVQLSSDLHYLVKFNKTVTDPPSIYEKLSDREYCSRSGVMSDRYTISKLINVFFIRALTARLANNSTAPIVNAVQPGYCVSGLGSDLGFPLNVVQTLSQKFAARTAEEGSRQVVYAAVGNSEDPDSLRGAYITLDCKVQEPSDYVISDEGAVVERRLWDETIDILSKVSPKVSEIVQQLSTSSL